MAVFNVKQVRDAASALDTMLKAGINLDFAMVQLSTLQPAFANFWSDSADRIRAGDPISAILEEAWAAPFVAAVTAGERAGRLQVVFKEIREAAELEIKLTGTVWKLAYPVGLMCAGVGVFVIFMGFVFPPLFAAINLKSGLLYEIATTIALVVNKNWMYSLPAFLGAIGLLALWLRTDEAKQQILDIAVSLPIIGLALKSMYFGLWARYMAVVTGAGIPTIEALRLTSEVLPESFRTGVAALETDLDFNNKSLSEAVNRESMAEDDPRREWPFYVTNAFLVAEQTGALDAELARVADPLVQDAVRQIERVVSLANIVAIALAATLIMLPMGSYYSEMFSKLGR